MIWQCIEHELYPIDHIPCPLPIHNSTPNEDNKIYPQGMYEQLNDQTI